MVIQVDTRDKIDKCKHVTDYFDKQGIKWVRSKCVVGDYVNLNNPMLVIDRKQNLQEVCGNVTQQHERFVRELELAKELNYHMIILVEEPGIHQLADVCSWYNWRRKHNPKALSGKTLYKIMKTMSEKYDIEWRFCSKDKCGKTIERLLKGEEECLLN